ncbi:hypothetical protein OU787_03805 [Kitasatospora sp. YST-16]|uniref:hypothetical protein n=1 Tax=Kitasatospora sp. YST-16 TaxID=2998080 RepID=UPI0022851F7F|nr:hypothetical protein [Kitasatospora sp. YST-16]WAL70695.1 hypothetical protein OU787_03805 [Kitasatospora sp. YST-16]
MRRLTAPVPPKARPKAWSPWKAQEATELVVPSQTATPSIGCSPEPSSTAVHTPPPAWPPPA